MTLDDLKSILEIEMETMDDPWSYQAFADCLKAQYSCWVLEDENKSKILGFIMFSHAVGEAHIINFAVAPKVQGQGLGRKLLEHALLLAKEFGNQIIYLEVKVSNEIAKNLYTKLGFIYLSTRPKYYVTATGREDAYVYYRDL